MLHFNFVHDMPWLALQISVVNWSRILDSLVIIHNINLYSIEIVLDISKAFEKADHAGTLYKIVDSISGTVVPDWMIGILSSLGQSVSTKECPGISLLFF